MAHQVEGVEDSAGGWVVWWGGVNPKQLRPLAGAASPSFMGSPSPPPPRCGAVYWVLLCAPPPNCGETLPSSHAGVSDMTVRGTPVHPSM